MPRQLPSSSSSCKADTGQQNKTDNTDVVDSNSYMPGYFRPNMNKAADNKASQVLTQKYTVNSVVFFSGTGCLKA